MSSIAYGAPRLCPRAAGIGMNIPQGSGTLQGVVVLFVFVYLTVFYLCLEVWKIKIGNNRKIRVLSSRVDDLLTIMRTAGFDVVFPPAQILQQPNLAVGQTLSMSSPNEQGRAETEP